MDLKPIYETTCQIDGCTNEVTGHGTIIRKRTCIVCKGKRISKRYKTHQAKKVAARNA